MNSHWGNSGELYVGYEGDGEMFISDGGEVYNDTNVYIGFAPGSRGTVDVNGLSTRMHTNDLYVGYGGTGVMNISNAGFVHNDVNGYIGFAPGSSGTVDVNSSEWDIGGPAIVGGELYVGYEGTGVMNIFNRGSVHNDANGYIGFAPGSSGSVDVNDSKWYNDGDLYVGYEGDGEMFISDGSYVNDDIGFIGFAQGSSGSVTVTGLNSHWDNSGELYVGYEGDGEMFISDGSYVNDDIGFIGFAQGSSGSVTVTGQGSGWNANTLYVGNEGEGEMLISDGGFVISKLDYIGFSLGSTGSVTVNGQGSLWESNYSLFVGYEGEGKLLISDGGYVFNDANGYIGFAPGSSGTVTVTGQDSIWENSDTLYVGYEGDGVMDVNDGGHVTSVEAQIGSLPGSRGRVTVTGQDSRWDSISIEVGGIQRDPITSEIFRGGTGLLSINNGGTVTSTEISVGGYTYDPITKDIGPGEMGLLNISNGGTLISNVQIHPSGILSGDGLISGSVMNTGAIKPGNSIGTLTIDGDLMMGHEFYPYSIYEVEVDNSGNSDLLSVTGEVFIVGGTVQAVSTETISGSQQYTIIEATNVTGTFDTLDTSLLRTGLFPKVSLDYGTDSVLLQIEATAFDDPSVVQTGNQSSLGRALQQIAAGGGNSITTALQNLKSVDQVRSAYNQLSGQTSPQLTPVTAADTSKFMGIVSDRLNYAGAGLSYYGFSSGPLLAMADPDKTGENASTSDTSPNFALGNGTMTFGDQEWGFWGRGYGVFGERDTGGEVAGYDYTVYGTTFGLDYQITDSTLLGITAGYSSGDVDSSLAGSKSDMSGTNIGIYGNKNMDDWHFDAILTYSFLEYETERVVNLMSEKLKGDTDGQGISGYLEARYDWRELYSWLLQPLASFQISYLDVDSYTESGGASSLAYDDQSYNSYKGSLGMKASRELFKRDNDLSAHIQLRGRWIHEFGDDNSSVDAHFASNPSAVFKVSDEDISRDSALLGVGLNADLSRRIRLMLGYDAQLNSDDTMHLLSAMFVYRW